MFINFIFFKITKICIIQQPLKLENNEHRFGILKIFVLFDFMYRSTEIVHLVSEIIPFKLLELTWQIK
jgi:hypothetical protein